MNRKNISAVVALVAIIGLAVVAPAFAKSNDSVTSSKEGQNRGIGKMMGTSTRPIMKLKDKSTSSTTPILGNGQPVIAGTISAINGSTFTLTNKGSIQYTVDASGAKFYQGKNIISLSDLKVGDAVVIQGAVSGSSITASSVIDQKASVNPTAIEKSKGKHFGFFGGIGNFFRNLFGF